MSDVINFWGPDEIPYGLFSNFAATPIIVDYDIYPTVEHYFQAMKTIDSVERKKIMTAATPKLAKELGRKAQMRPDWEQIKNDIMYIGLKAKAKYSREFHDLLLSTGDAKLVENSPYDRYWGCGRDGTGLNKLGELLEQLRTSIQGGAI